MPVVSGRKFRPLSPPGGPSDFQDLPQSSKRLEPKGDWRPPSPTPPSPGKEPETLRGGDAEPAARVTRLGRSSVSWDGGSFWNQKTGL